MNKQSSLLCAKFRNLRLILIKKVSTLVRSSAELEESVFNAVKNNVKPKHHPGIMHHGPIALPDGIKMSISKLLSGEVPKNQMLLEAKPLERYLMARKPSIEKNEYFEKRAEIRNEVLSSLGMDIHRLNQEEQGSWNKIMDEKVDRLVKKKLYSWNRINFTKYMSQLYVVTRSAAEYTVLYKIFKEISTRGNFIPNTVFDFGSGIGSVIWAADSIWGNSIKEYYCVDSSSHMNSVNEEIIRGCGGNFTNKIFYRQFLPASNDITSDIVVSSYSLLELSSKDQRLETISNLWSKTKSYLVLIERGSAGGFKLLNEAREHILSQIKMKESEETSYIFAPCPHDLPCPRAEKKCYFEASYFSFPQKPEAIKKEFYSYVVFKKGVKNEEVKQWPRIVQPVLCRSRHVICRLCCKTGDLKEVIITSSKHGKISYKCAKASNWGDLFPYNMKPYKEVEGTEGDMKS